MSEIPRAAHSQRGRHREPRPTLEQWARAYQRRGWTVVPVRHRGKAPTQRGWAARRGPLGDAALREHFGGATLNIGIATGAASGRLVDVDLDCDEAVIAASTLLPCTGLRSGRTSRPQSHYWYTLHPSDGLLLGGIPTLRFSIPGDLFSDGRPRFGERAKPAHSASAPSEHEAMLVELRYDGHQTIVEPSLHPSGEPVEWQATNDAKEVTALVLLRAVGRVAAAALLARYWAPRGHRDECALALTGALLRMGWTTADTDVFVRAVARAAGDDEWRRRAKAGALATRLSDLPNAPTRGWPSVAELLAAPSGERVATLARVWLGLWVRLRAGATRSACGRTPAHGRTRWAGNGRRGRRGRRGRPPCAPTRWRGSGHERSGERHAPSGGAQRLCLGRDMGIAGRRGRGEQPGRSRSSRAGARDARWPRLSRAGARPAD